MPGISGKEGSGLVGGTTIQELTAWSFNPTSNNPAYASNTSAGYKRRVAGVKDGSGSVDGKWDPANPITGLLDVGTFVTLNLVITGAQKYIVPAIVDGLTLEIDLDDGEVTGWSVDYSTNGAWTNPSAAAFMGPQFLQAPPAAPQSFSAPQATPPGPLSSFNAQDPAFLAAVAQAVAQMMQGQAPPAPPLPQSHTGFGRPVNPFPQPPAPPQGPVAPAPSGAGAR